MSNCSALYFPGRGLALACDIQVGWDLAQWRERHTDYEGVLREFFIKAFWRSSFNEEMKGLTGS